MVVFVKDCRVEKRSSRQPHKLEIVGSNPTPAIGPGSQMRASFLYSPAREGAGATLDSSGLARQRNTEKCRAARVVNNHAVMSSA